MSKPISIHYQVPLGGVKLSTNKSYAGIHWSKRKSIKDSIASYAGAFCRPIKVVESYPVQIRYQFVFKSKPLDSLNTAIMAKMLEDAICALGILKDDTPRYVAQAILDVSAGGSPERAAELDAQRSKDIKENEDYVMIHIEPYEP